MGLRQLSETVKEPVLWSQDFPGFSYAWSWATFAGLAQLPAILGGHTNLISDPHMVWTQHTDIFGTSTSTSTTVNGSQKVVNLGVCGVTDWHVFGLECRCNITINALSRRRVQLMVFAVEHKLCHKFHTMFWTQTVTLIQDYGTWLRHNTTSREITDFTGKCVD